MNENFSHQTFEGAKSAYDLARTLLAQQGIYSADQAYAAVPDMPPRTVRRIFECGAVLKDNGLLIRDTQAGAFEVVVESPLSLKDTISPDDITTITEKAKAAGVKPWSAVTAVMKFGNPLERVIKVLEDIVTLAKEVKPARSPSGLFIHAMRHGSDIKLPEGREEAKEKAHAPLSVGEWVRWNLEWMKVLVINGMQVLLSPTEDPDDSYKVPLDNILHLPRRSALGVT